METDPLDIFINEILDKKKEQLGKISPQARHQVVSDLKERLLDQINRALIDALPDQKIAEFNVLLDDEHFSDIQVQDFISRSGVDVEATTVQAMVRFSESYLGRREPTTKVASARKPPSNVAGPTRYIAPAGPRRGADVEAHLTLSFRDAVQGSTVSLRAGSGSNFGARIPPGIKNGQKVRFRGKGKDGDVGASGGDLFLSVRVEQDPDFGRDGDNLTSLLLITSAEAALGATVPVPMLFGEPVKIRIPVGTRNGQVLRFKGRGIATKGHLGDLLAKVRVAIPKS